MDYKFVYCNDSAIADTLMDKLELIDIQEVSGKKTWIFENNINFLQFCNDEVKSGNLKFSNKLYI